MSCFWSSLIQKISIEDFKIYLNYNNNNKPNPQNFAELLKNNNRKSDNIYWNNIKPSLKQMDENYEAVNCYNTNTVNDGYFTSTFEPFLFLVAEIFEVTIEHCYNGYNQVYENKKKSRTIWRFGSNTGHFYVR